MASKLLKFVFFYIISWSTEGQVIVDETGDNRICVPMRSIICKNLEYNHTIMPNFVGHATQEDAERRINDYRALINIECSRYFRFFLCTVYFPMCNHSPDGLVKLRPCQSLCTYVKSKCEPIMKKLDLEWPIDLNCASLPKADSQLCIEPQNYDQDSLDLYPKERISLKTEGTIPPLDMRSCNAAQLRIVTEQNQPTQCVYRCDSNVFYRPINKRLASVWMLVWSCLSLFSCLMTIITFFRNSKRFTYPERPIIYLTACCMMQLVGFLVRGFVGAEEVACTSRFVYNSSTSTSSELTPSSKFLIVSGQESKWCTVNFIFVYFFGQASTIWFVALSVGWFLSTHMKWSAEGIKSISRYFHLFAWPIPAILTMILLIMHQIEADELTGLCYMGIQKWNILLIFSIIPSLLATTLGIIFLLLGFCSVISVRSDLKYNNTLQESLFWNDSRGEPQKMLNTVLQKSHVERLDKLVTKIGLLAIMFLLPKSSLIAIEFYLYIFRKKWIDSIYFASKKTNCITNLGLNWERFEDCIGDAPYPGVEISLLYIFMTCAIGLGVGLCIWCNKKSFNSFITCRETTNITPAARNILSSSYVYAPPQSRVNYSSIPPSLYPPSPHQQCSRTSDFQLISTNTSTNNGISGGMVIGPLSSTNVPTIYDGQVGMLSNTSQPNGMLRGPIVSTRGQIKSSESMTSSNDGSEKVRINNGVFHASPINGFSKRM